MNRLGNFVVWILVNAFAQLTTTNANGLTVAEVAQFNVSGRNGTYVLVNTSLSDRFVFYASGMPDHDWEMVNTYTPTVQNYVIEIPRNPQQSQIPGCLPMGIIGLTRTGVALYNPLNVQDQNAVEGATAEVVDSCDGHTDESGVYHYHKLPKSCLYRHEVDEFIGVALDGYPIYGPMVSAGWINQGGLAQGGNVTSAHLDKCHGTTVNGNYRYYMTTEFPYILGCFKGTVIFRNKSVTYNCVNDTSIWNNDWNNFLCHCSTQVGSNGTDSPVSRRKRNVVRSECPPDEDLLECLLSLRCSSHNVTRPVICDMFCSGIAVEIRPAFCDIGAAATTSAPPKSSTTKLTSRATPPSAAAETTTTITPATAAASTTTTTQSSIENKLSGAISYKPCLLITLFLVSSFSVFMFSFDMHCKRFRSTDARKIRY